jgi:hypothetical protein
MSSASDAAYIAFEGDRCIARGDLRGAARAAKAALDQRPDAPILIFDGRSSGAVELGVVAREITLLPRHWEWLGQQSGGASVAIRKLVEEARRNGDDKQRIREAQEAAYRFMSVMAGNKPHYEDAIRALFAPDPARFEKLIAGWPQDVRDHALRLAERAFQRHIQPAAG